MTNAERNRNYKLRHPERVKESRRIYRSKPDVMARQREREKRRRLKARQNAVASLGGKCVKCGFSDHRALQIDHVNGGGLKDRKSFNLDCVAFYKKVVIESESGIYQILCANCNWIKRYENEEFGGSPRKHKDDER